MQIVQSNMSSISYLRRLCALELHARIICMLNSVAESTNLLCFYFQVKICKHLGLF